MSNAERTFGEDVEIIRDRFDAIVLSNDDGGKLLLSASLQGRTMTSTATGDDGTSFGFLNYSAIASQTIAPQINLYGGEDRFWISPEGGQFSVFFDPDVPMEFVNWRTPPSLDTEPFDVVAVSDLSASFSRQVSLMNMSRFRFELRLDRTVTLLGNDEVAGRLGVSFDGLAVVAHESDNGITNIGSQSWHQETGLIGVWSICMSKPADEAVLLAPFQRGPESELGQIVETNYFGELDGSRIRVNEDLGLVFLRGDGDYRSKIGMTPARATPIMGSWNPEMSLLTIIQYSLPKSASHGYTNNLWKFQDEPFAGDALNCYNDGPNESGEKFGGFYELESISPALALSPGESANHVVWTIRVQGDRGRLNGIAQKVFGVSIEQIESQLKPLA